MAPNTLLGVPKEQKLIGYDASKADNKSFTLIEFTTPVPEPGDDDVLVHVTDSAVNPVDYKLATYNFFGRKDNVSLGFDYAGKVVKIGSNVQHVKPGDDVFGYLYLTKNGAWSADGKGGFQVGHKDLVVKRDPQFPAEAAGTYAIAYLSAWDALSKNLNEGESVYIPGAASGVSHYAIQLAKTTTDKIITSASRPETEKVAKDFGVPCFNYKKSTPETEVKKHFKEGANVVFDCTYSEASHTESAKALAQGGKLVILGDLPKDDSEAAKIVKQKKGHMIMTDLIRYFVDAEHHDKKFLQQGFEQAQKLYIEGKVRPVISQTVKANVKDLQKVLQEVHDGKGIGKIAVKNVY